MSPPTSPRQQQSKKKQQPARNNPNTQQHQQQQQQRIHFLNALATVPVPPNLLQDGVKVWQVAANGSTKLVVLKLSNDKFTLTLEPVKSKRTGFLSIWGGSSNSNNERRSIDIGEIDRFQRGQSTIEFEKAKKNMKNPAARTMSVTTTTKEEEANNTNSNGGTTSNSTTQGNNDIECCEATVSSTDKVGVKSKVVVTESTAAAASVVSSSSKTTTTTTTTAQQQQQAASLDPSRSFSIIFRGAHTVDLMTAGSSLLQSTERTQEVCNALDKLLVAYQRAKKRVATDVQLLRYVWLHTVSSSASSPSSSPSSNNNKSGGGNNSPTSGSNKGSKLANSNTVNKILQEINFGLPTSGTNSCQSMYDKFGKVIGLDRGQRRAGLSFEQTATFLHKLKRDSWMVKPVTVLWNELFGEVMNNGKLRTTVSDKTFLERFLHNQQGEVHATILDVRKLFRRLHDMEIAHTTGSMIDLNRINKDQFEAYLLMSENDAFDPAKEKFDKADMDQPLSEYWINSSHNTYLIGDQYKSHSSVEMYSNALYRGSRCLELDIWDGGKDPSNTPIPVVWHGHTMTTKIRFADIIQTIKVFLNFHPDTFPIILSFENHCSIPYQQVMASTLEKILGDSLYVPTEVSLYGQLPSPSQLRGMVVIKGRRPDGTEADAYDTDDDSDDEDVEGTSSMGVLTLEDIEKRETVVRHGVAPELARLTLFHGKKINTWEESTKSPTWHMHSFSENKVRSRCRHKEAYQWIVYNQTHMSRTYPAGSRVDSSNYNPLLAWSNGCQMAALNFQTQDAFLRLNDGRFRENNNCGYVLKPPSLMLKGDFDPVARPVRLSIRILSGSCLPKPRGQRQGDCIDPYVKVSVFDVKNEEKETVTSYPTSTVSANGFFPIWGQEKFSFIIDNWSVAMVQLTVLDKSKDEFIASSSIPISCLRRGIRNVKLYDATNTRSGAFDFASLLVDIKIGQVIAEI